MDVRTHGPLSALIIECEARSDRRDLPLDVVEAVASALADAIIADMRADTRRDGADLPEVDYAKETTEEIEVQPARADGSAPTCATKAPRLGGRARA